MHTMKSTLLIKKHRMLARAKEPKSLSQRDYWKMKTQATLREINASTTPQNTQER